MADMRTERRAHFVSIQSVLWLYRLAGLSHDVLDLELPAAKKVVDLELAVSLNLHPDLVAVVQAVEHQGLVPDGLEGLLHDRGLLLGPLPIASEEDHNVRVQARSIEGAAIQQLQVGLGSETGVNGRARQTSQRR